MNNNDEGLVNNGEFKMSTNREKSKETVSILQCVTRILRTVKDYELIFVFY